jgi:hypothetical protein
MSNVFGITKKSVNFFVNMFNNNKRNEDNLRKYVETEYRPIDWNWAYEQNKRRFGL